MKLTVSAAIGAAWDELGRAIVKAGREDSSGERRFLAAELEKNNLQTVADALQTSTDEAARLRDNFVKAYGEAL